MVEQTVSVKVNVEGKNVVIAYLLWWFLGGFGIHRFYLGRVFSGITQLLLFVIGWASAAILVGYVLLFVWLIWWIIDVFLVYQIVKTENQKKGVDNSTFSMTKTGEIDSEISQLEKLHSLYEKGVLSEEQYAERKAQILK